MICRRCGLTSRQPLPLRAQRLRPIPEGPKNRSINSPYGSEPETLAVWLHMARSECLDGIEPA